MIGKILTELCLPEHSTVETHRNSKMSNYLPFIDILGKNIDYDNKERNAQKHTFIHMF